MTAEGPKRGQGQLMPGCDCSLVMASWEQAMKGADVPSKSSGGKRGRSAITGRFVKQSTVKRSPKTTTNESTKSSKKGKK